MTAAPAESFETAIPFRTSPTRPAPSDHGAEAALLGACLIDTQAADQAISTGLTADAFDLPAHRTVFSAISAIRAAGLPTNDPALLFSHLDASITPASFIVGLQSAAPTTLFATPHAARILELSARRQILRDTARLTESLADLQTPIGDLTASFAQRLTDLSASSTSIRSRYANRAFNLTNPPPDTPARISIAGRPACSPGNITNLIAQSKVGKSSFLSGIIGAAIVSSHNTRDRDTLGVTALSPGTARFIHIDTEQSPHDHDQLIRLCLRRAGVESPPPWLLSYGLAGFNAQDLRSALSDILRAQSRHGIFAIALDGAADFVNDVNDPGECNPFVAELHGIAIAHNCPLITVVHENPGQDFGKMRGHLGSQLERKAESNLRLRKQDEVTVVFSEKMRKAPILESDGPRFAWSNDQNMHVSVASKSASKDEEKLSDLRDLAEEVFSGDTLRYADACRKIEEVRRVGEKASEKWFTLMKKHRVISRAPLGFWRETL